MPFRGSLNAIALAQLGLLGQDTDLAFTSETTPDKPISKMSITAALRTRLEQINSKLGKPLGKSTMRSILTTLREFILWLPSKTGFAVASKRRTRIISTYHDVMKPKPGQPPTGRPQPKPSQARAFTNAKCTLHQKRDKAIFTLLFLTGIRVAALVSLKIKHVDLIEQSVTQNPREVATKFGKSIDSFFARGFEDAEAALAQWITYCDEVALYGPDRSIVPFHSHEA